MPLESLTGIWSNPTINTLNGEINDPILLEATVIDGNETAENQEVNTAIKVATPTKTAGILAFLTFDEDWNMDYAKCILDYENQKLAIDLIIAEQTVTIGEKGYPLEYGTRYQLKVVAKANGTIIFYVNNVAQFNIDNLTFSRGMYGFFITGIVGDSALFILRTMPTGTLILRNAGEHKPTYNELVAILTSGEGNAVNADMVDGKHASELGTGGEFMMFTGEMEVVDTLPETGEVGVVYLLTSDGNFYVWT